MVALPVLLLMVLGTAFVSARAVDSERRRYPEPARNSSSDQTSDIASGYLRRNGSISGPADQHQRCLTAASGLSVAIEANVIHIVRAGLANHFAKNQSTALTNQLINRSLFLEAIEKLHRSGFRHGRDPHHRNIIVLGETRRTDGAASHAPAFRNDASSRPLPTGAKPFNMSSLPYHFQRPYLTVHTSDLETEDKLAIYISASVEHNMSCNWFLNGRPLGEYDVMETKDIGSYEVDNRTFLKRACHLEEEHVLKLPTLTGSYEFYCLVTMDSSSKMVTHMLSPLLTDSCPPANCYTRNALCQEGTCTCGGAYPVRLDSVHVTCRPAALLERPCLYHRQCLHVAEHSECVEERWCACKPGYGRTQNYLCTEKTGVNARCETDDDCQLFNARCILSHCLCNRTATEDNNRCVDIGFWGDHVHRIHGSATAPGLSTRVILVALSFVACLSKL